MLGNSEKFCGAGAQNIYMFVGQIGGESRDVKKRGRREVGCIFLSTN